MRAARFSLLRVEPGAHSVGGRSAGCFALRLVNGLAGALCVVPLETLISQASPSERRTRNFSFYAVALTVGGAIGIWAGNRFFEPDNHWTFTLGGLVPILAGAWLARLLPTPACESSATTVSAPLDWSRQVLSYGSAFFQGFLEGGMLAFLSLYLIASRHVARCSGGPVRHHDGRRCRLSGSGGLVGGSARTNADAFRMLRRRGCRSRAGAAVWTIRLAGDLPVSLGSILRALYPMALALLGDRLPPARLARAYAWFLAMECVGSQVGAAVMGQARDWWGEASMFTVGLVVLAVVIGVWVTLATGASGFKWQGMAP